jgi:transposase-like protein
MNLLEFQELFPHEAACEAYLIQTKWPEGFICPECHVQNSFYIRVRRTFECKNCHKQTAVTAKTMFERSQTPLLVWFYAIYLVTESKKGVSGLELQHHLGMKDVRRAYRLRRKIQEAMASRENLYLLEGFVE